MTHVDPRKVGHRTRPGVPRAAGAVAPVPDPSEDGVVSLSLSPVVESPGDPASPRPSDAFVQLGVAFAGRSHDVVQRVAARVEQRSGVRRDAATHRADEPVHARHDVLQRTEIATEALARLIATGSGPNLQHLTVLSAAGQAALARPAPPAELVAWHLCWRDVVGEVLAEVGARIGTDDVTLDKAAHLVHAGADAALVAMIARLDADATEVRTRLQEDNARLADGLLHDPVTGVANRTLLMDRFAHCLQGCVRRFSGVAVYVVDLDDFDTVDESLGEGTSDHLLRLVASRLCSAVRTSDTVARLADGQFVVLCEDFRGGQPSASTVAERLASAMAEPFALGGRAVTVTASTGVTLGGPGDDPEELLAMAGSAMELARQRGRGRTERFHRAADHH